MACARKILEGIFSSENELKLASYEAKDIFLNSGLYDSEEIRNWLSQHPPYNIDTKKDGNWSLEFTQDVPLSWVGTGEFDINFAKQALSADANTFKRSVTIEILADENIASITFTIIGQ